MSPPTTPLPALSPGPPLVRVGAVIALLASASQVLSGFHRWDPELGRVGLDVSPFGDPPALLSVGISLLVLAALPALALLVTPRGWPRLVSAAATMAVVLWWVALGPVGPVAAGVWLAAAGACGHLVAAALAP